MTEQLAAVDRGQSLGCAMTFSYWSADVEDTHTLSDINVWHNVYLDWCIFHLL